ncbi:MAG: hypothetical protein QOK88_02655 [Nitrososphaeraceae archaeon]|jgi:hypothetical protein|nr:hypothetical protein [Nitrososphaeraceae archaeon]MDW0134390.1 hypothetical protein [Nitrososphaeraceae archaeon]MDW0154840.1 hypothetical protein [Nitrososphaeraceae archaeon]
MDKVLVVFPSIVIIFVILVAIGSQTQLNAAITVSNSTLSEERFVGQKTEMSNPASPTVTPHGKIPHQIVFALPLRNDSKIWTGIVTFTASKPIEIEVLHLYKPQSTIDAEHGEPYHATLPNNMTVAISTMTMFTDTPVKVTDTPISTGSLQFTGSALVFHKTSGEPFTVTYTVDAVARSPDQ